MTASDYLLLFGSTTGALLALFLIVMILGYRRPRSFERVLFFLALAQLSFFTGTLLFLNAKIYYAEPPAGTQVFAGLLVLLGMIVSPGLLVHLHLDYLHSSSDTQMPRWGWLVIGLAYLPVLLLLLSAAEYAIRSGTFVGWFIATPISYSYWTWLVVAISLSAGLEVVLARRAKAAGGKRFHSAMAADFALLSLLPLSWILTGPVYGGPSSGLLAATFWLVLGLVPSALLCYAILRHHALGFGEQRNLVYTVSGAFLALLYLALVRRAEGWFASILPPDATAAILLFTLVFLFEPIQRRVGRGLRRTFHSQVERLQKLEADLQREARGGDLARLQEFAERRIRDEFSLARVEINLGAQGSSAGELQVARPAPGEASATSFPLREGARAIGVLEVGSHGAALSGETYAALEALSQRLPAIIDFCRLIEEKLLLERELAARERMALLGQMAASVSHNLKNPLGSMKTVLQVRLEDRKLPEDLRRDLELVLGEIERLSAKLAQLLKYSRPTVRAEGASESVDAAGVARQVVALLGREAERRGARLVLESSAEQMVVRGNEEALSDVISNLVVNAIETFSGSGGAVQLGLKQRGANVALEVSDNGPGIPEASREKIFQPFFTTKPSGTGLGLAIVARRVAEMDGSIEWVSPVAGGRGARFTVTLSAAERVEKR